MKKLFLSLVLIPCLAFGQKKDNIIAKIIGSGTEVFPKSQAELFYESKSKQDTIRVLMLVCDTSMEDFTPIDTIEISSGKVLGSGFIPYYNNSVQWQFGYEVIAAINNMLWYPNFYVEYSPSGFPYIVKEYLDENKKPLSKNIVVWQTKEIK